MQYRTRQEEHASTEAIVGPAKAEQSPSFNAETDRAPSSGVMSHLNLMPTEQRPKATGFLPSEPLPGRATYHPATDTIAYMGREPAAHARRIDSYLTVMTRSNLRSPVGFQLKGFERHYLDFFSRKRFLNQPEEVWVALAIEMVADDLRHELLKDEDRRLAYEVVANLAFDHRVTMQLDHSAARVSSRLDARRAS